MANDMQFFESQEITVFPKREIVYYDIDTMNKDTSMQRLNVYSKLYNSESGIILTKNHGLGVPFRDHFNAY